MQQESHFPIKIRYTETGEEEVIDSPIQIKNGKAFIVVETKVKK